jgi:hypothetical protein
MTKKKMENYLHEALAAKYAYADVEVSLRV